MRCLRCALRFILKFSLQSHELCFPIQPTLFYTFFHAFFFQLLLNDISLEFISHNIRFSCTFSEYIQIYIHLCLHASHIKIRKFIIENGLNFCPFTFSLIFYYLYFILYTYISAPQSNSIYIRCNTHCKNKNE